MKHRKMAVAVGITTAFMHLALAEQDVAAQLEAQRQANLARMANLTAPGGTTSACASSTPNTGGPFDYARCVAARVKPNIVYTGPSDVNLSALVEVRMAPNGTIVNRRLLRSSGVRDWDDAVMRALDKTVFMPPDGNGRVPPVIEIGFRLRE